MWPSPTEMSEVMDYLRTMRQVRGMMPKPKDLVYVGMEDLLLRHGRSFTPAPFPKRWVRRTIRECFNNAYVLCSRAKGLRYAEGIAAGIIPVHHAWAVTETGEAVDPTWPEVGTEYFGVTIPLSRVREVRRRGWIDSVLENYRDRHRALREPWPYDESVT